jgi:hypothetical protein
MTPLKKGRIARRPIREGFRLNVDLSDGTAWDQVLFDERRTQTKRIHPCFFFAASVPARSSPTAMCARTKECPWRTRDTSRVATMASNSAKDDSLEASGSPETCLADFLAKRSEVFLESSYDRGLGC